MKQENGVGHIEQLLPLYSALCAIHNIENSVNLSCRVFLYCRGRSFRF